MDFKKIWPAPDRFFVFHYFLSIETTAITVMSLILDSLKEEPLEVETGENIVTNHHGKIAKWNARVNISGRAYLPYTLY